MKSECPTYLKSKGKAMAVTLSDGEVSNESKCDEDGNFITFTATAVVNESICIFREFLFRRVLFSYCCSE